MKIQVLGSGCPTCKKLYEITQKAADELQINAPVEYITGQEGMKKIISLGAMSSPVIAVNDEVAMTGFTPDIEKIKSRIQKTILKMK
jgi:small redox-active disulfide protein 2